MPTDRPLGISTSPSIPKNCTTPPTLGLTKNLCIPPGNPPNPFSPQAGRYPEPFTLYSRSHPPAPVESVKLVPNSLL